MSNVSSIGPRSPMPLAPRPGARDTELEIQISENSDLNSDLENPHLHVQNPHLAIQIRKIRIWKSKLGKSESGNPDPENRDLAIQIRKTGIWKSKS